MNKKHLTVKPCRKETDPLRLSLLAKLTGLVLTGLFVLCSSLLAQIQTFSSSDNFIVPSGVTSITVECWGAGGGGSNRAGAAGGGGGGAYTRGTLTVTPGASIPVTVGVGGAVGVNGGQSSVGSIIANGGTTVNNSRTGGTGGAASAIGGNIIASYSGGNGGNARANAGGGNNEGGGGGGGSATSTANGGAGGNATAIGGNGGTGSGNGGRGADGDGTPDAVVGTAPGGGGGGRGENAASTSKSGANGYVVITWVQPYFSQGSLDPNLRSSWNTSPTGGGAQPPATNTFTSDDQYFIIQSGHNMTTTATGWTVTGNNTSVTISNGGTLTETTAISLSANTTLQVDDGGALNHNVNSESIFGGTEVFGTNSTVNYGYAGAQNVIAAAYGNLTLSGTGTKTLLGNASVAGLLTLSGVTLNIGANTITTASFTKSGSIVINISTGTFTVNGNMAFLPADAIAFSGAGTLNVLGNLTNGALTGSTGTINVGGNFAPSTFTVGSSTVNCNGSGTQTIGAFAYFNLQQTGTGTVRLNGNTSVSNAFTFQSGTIDCQNNNFTLSGSVSYTGGTFLPGTSTVTYDGTAVQDIIPATYNTLSISNTNTHTLRGNITVNAAFTNAGSLACGTNDLTLIGTTSCGGTISATGGTVTYGALATNVITGNYFNLTSNGATLCGNVTVGGTLTLTAGALAINNYQLTMNGALTQTGGTLTGGGTSDIIFGGTGASTALPAVSGGIRNLTLNRANGISLSGNNTVNGTLTLTSGKLTLGAYDLTITGTSAISGYSATNYIIADGTGQLKKVFASGATAAYTLPIGDVSSHYSPVVLTFTANSIQRTIGVRVTDAQHPNDGTTIDYISKYWSFTDDQAGTYTYTALFSYSTVAPTDQSGTFTYANVNVNRWDGSVWTQYTTTRPGAPSFTISGQTQATAPFNNSDFTARVNPVTYIWQATTGSADWTTPASWSPARNTPATTDVLLFNRGGASTAINVPTQTIARIVVSGNTNISLQTSGGVARTLTINGGAMTNLNVQAGATLQLNSTTTNQITLAFTGTQNVAIAGDLIINANTALTNTYNATNSNTIVTGTIRNNGGTITSTAANLNFNAGGTYNHARNGGAIPTATWNQTSNCNITGYTTTVPTGLGQSFGNFNYSSNAALNLTAGLTVTGNLDVTTGSVTANTQTINLTGNFTGNGGLSFTTGTLNIGGSFTNSGTFTPGTGTVNFNGAGDQQVAALNYYNLAIAGGTRTVTLANTGTIGIANTFTPNAAPTYVNTGSTVNYNSTGNQNITAFNYNNLTVTGGAGIVKTLSGNITLAGDLALNSANVALANYDLTIAGNITTTNPTSFDGNHMILTDGTGELVKQGNNGVNFTTTYPLGAGGHYTPMVIGSLSATVGSGSTLAVRVVPQQREPLGSALSRYWSITTQNITSMSANIKFTYDASDVVGVIANYAVRRFDGSAFQNVPGGIINTGTREISSSGTTILTGDWTAIDPNSTIPGITGPTQVFQNRTQVYTTSSGMTGYNWNVTGGSITSQNANSAVILWDNSPGTGSVSVSYTQNSTVYNLPALEVTRYAFPSCFLYSQAININGSMINGGPHTNFPVMISLTNANFRSVSHSGHISSDLGYDVYFAANSNGSGRLEHQLDTYDPVTGKIVAWVNIPLLSNAGTTIYMFYGNNDIGFDASTASIWSADYVGVYHLGQSVLDFGRAGNDGINGGTTVVNDGKAGQARAFSRANKNFIQLENEPVFNFTNGQTVSFWLRINSFSPQPWGDYISKGDQANWRFVTNGTTGQMYYSFGFGGTDNGFTSDNPSGNNAVTAGTGNWYYVVGTFDGTTRTKKILVNTVRWQQVNGVGGVTLPTTMQSYTVNNYPVLLGINSQADDQRAFDGTMDELRISNVAKTEPWLTTEYNNQNNPGAYITLSGTESTLYTPDANGGTAQASPTTLFAREYTTVSVTGYTGDRFQWQSSTDSINYTDLEGKITDSFVSDPILSKTWFRVKVKVTDVGCPAVSVPVAVTAIAPYLSCNSGYRKRITLSKANGSDDLINFPVLIRIASDPDLVYNATTPGMVKHPQGYDIRFAASDGLTILSQQRESYNNTTGAYTAWVQVPRLSASTTTDIYLYYGDATITTDPSSPSTWSPEYLGVWHMGTNGTYTGLNDATTGGTNGTPTNAPTVLTGANAFINEATGLNGTNQYVTLNNEAKFDLNAGGALTVSAWVYATGYANQSRFISKEGTGPNSGWSMRRATTSPQTEFVQNYTAPEFLRAINTSGVATGGWHYVVGTFDHALNNIVVYIDGSPAASSKNDPANETIVNNNNNVRFGADAGATNNFLNGRLDEVRIQNVARTGDWIKTEYDNQRAGSTFYTITTDDPCTGTSAVGGTATAAKYTLCSGQTTTLTLTGYSGGIYWQSSTDNLNWNYISGANLPTVTVGPILQKTYFRAAVSKCCEVYSDTVTLDYISSIPPALNFAVTNVTCNGGTDGAIDLSVSQGTAPYNYAWTNGAITEDIGPVAPATYSVVVTDANGCSTNGTAVVTQPAALTAGVIGTAQAICYGATPSALTETTPPVGGTGVYTYQWQISTDNVSFTNIPTATLSSYSPGALTANTWYRRIVTSAPCGSQTSASVGITINPRPSVTLGTNPSVCAGTTSASLTYSDPTNTPDQYTITYDADAIAENFSNITDNLPVGSITLSVPGSANPGTYNGILTVRNTITGCISSDYPITIGVNSSAVAPTSASSDRDAFCSNAGGNISLSVSGGSGTTVRWFTGGCGTTSIGTGNPLSISAPTASTTYYARWENGCGNSTCASVLVTVYDLPTVSITSGSGAMCVNNTRALTGNPGGGTFTILGTSTATGTIDGSDVLTATGAGTLNIQYSYTDGVTNCSNTAVQAITVNAVPVTGPAYRLPNN